MDKQFRQNGAFSWCELLTTDVDKASEFYIRLFGWGTENMSMPGMPYTVVKAGGMGIGGIVSVSKNAQVTLPMWSTFVTVKDVDATAQTAEQLGATLLVRPKDIPGGRFCVIRDPQGAVISTIAYADM